MTCGGHLTNPTKNIKNCSGERCQGKSRRNKKETSSTSSTSIVVRTATPTTNPTLSSVQTTFPNSILNAPSTSTATPQFQIGAPGPTPTAWGTPTPFGYETVNDPDFQDAVKELLPSVGPSFTGFDANQAWNSFLQTLPSLIGLPATSLEEIAVNLLNRIPQTTSPIPLFYIPDGSIFAPTPVYQ